MTLASPSGSIRVRPASPVATRMTPVSLHAPGPRSIRASGSFDGYEEVAGRVAAFWPDEGQRAAFSHAGVRLTVLNLHHGRGRNPTVQNLGLLLDVGGLRLLHVGDTEVSAADVRPYRLREEGIDVALVPYWLLLYDNFRPMLEELGARHTVAMHLPSRDAPESYFDPAQDLEGLKDLIRELHPRVWVPERALAARRFR